jgi:hypothetical protein
LDPFAAFALPAVFVDFFDFAIALSSTALS